MGVTSVRLQPDIEGLLEDLTKKLDRSKNYLINLVVKEFVARRLVEGERWEETLQAIRSVEAGRRIEEKAVARWLESWGTEDERDPPKI